MNLSDINEEYIKQFAVNNAALNNGLKISRSGGFVKLYKTADEQLIFGECRGSGKEPYSASADFSEDTPIFRCSCPSRQIPCKHCLGLLYEAVNKKNFTTAEVPEDIKRKRDKKAASAEKKAKSASAPPKPNKSAAAKKLKKQREGLELAQTMLHDLFSRGVTTMNPTTAVQYKELVKQLGDHYLPEPQAILSEIITASQRNTDKNDDKEVDRIIALCIRLSSIIKKSMTYIDEKLSAGDVLPEDNILYEQMGGVWKMTQLGELGLSKENAVLLQLAFSVIDDAPHKAEVDTGFWMDMENGEIVRTENIRPYRAAKHIKKENSTYGLCLIPHLYFYPGSMNRRVRWESTEISDIGTECLERAISLAADIPTAIKAAKNELKNSISRPYAAVLLKCDSIGFAGNVCVIYSGDESITVEDRSGSDIICTLKVIGNKCADGAVFGELYYDPDDHRFTFSPRSVITKSELFRL